MKALETAPGLRQGTQCVKQRTQDSWPGCMDVLPSCPQAQPGAQGGSGWPPCPSPLPQKVFLSQCLSVSQARASAQDVPLGASGAPGGAAGPRPQLNQPWDCPQPLLGDDCSNMLSGTSPLGTTWGLRVPLASTASPRAIFSPVVSCSSTRGQASSDTPHVCTTQLRAPGCCGEHSSKQEPTASC